MVLQHSRSAESLQVGLRNPRPHARLHRPTKLPGLSAKALASAGAGRGPRGGYLNRLIWLFAAR